MSEPAHMVGYGRPPEHTRFQKGQSGNPGGKPKPKTGVKHAFDIAVEEALSTNQRVLNNSEPANVVQAFVRRVALDAVDGEPSAQRLLVSIIERGGSGAAENSPATPTASSSSEERTRELLGERYDEFTTRFAQAVATGNGDELLALAREFNQVEKFPQ